MSLSMHACCIIALLSIYLYIYCLLTDQQVLYVGQSSCQNRTEQNRPFASKSNVHRRINGQENAFGMVQQRNAPHNIYTRTHCKTSQPASQPTNQDTTHITPQHTTAPPTAHQATPPTS